VTALEQISEDDHPALAARLWLALSLLHSGKRKFDCAVRARGLYIIANDEHGQAHALRSSARGLLQMGRFDEAVAGSTDALVTFRELKDGQGEALSLNVLADIAVNTGDVDPAREIYEQTLNVYQSLGDEAGKATVLADIAELHFEIEDPEQALRDVQQAIEIDSRRKNATNLAMEYSNSTAYRIALGDLAGARDSARQGLRWAQRAQSGSKLAWVLQHFALMAGLGGNLETAARLRGYVDKQFSELGLQRESTERWGYEKLTALLNETIGEDEMQQLAVSGAAWSEGHAVEEALAI
jgi:tetratricopeptide (TPR) repeat protein